MMVPAYAAVTSLDLAETTYKLSDKFAFKGEEDTGSQQVFVVIRNPSGGYVGMVADVSSDADGIFLTIPRPADDFFTSKGIYNATAFTDDQTEEEGLTIKIEYDGTKIFVRPDFTLKLSKISANTVEVKKTLTFTATLTDSTIKNVVYSLEKNPPTGSSIDSTTGKFTWTPTETQGPASYLFDIVVKKGAIEDRQTITINVTEANAAPTGGDDIVSTNKNVNKIFAQNDFTFYEIVYRISYI